MKLCDNCGCETKQLIQLNPEFDSLEVCQACHDRLVAKIETLNARVAKAVKSMRRKAFERWQEEDPVSAKVRRGFQFMEMAFESLRRLRQLEE